MSHIDRYSEYIPKPTIFSFRLFNVYKNKNRNKNTRTLSENNKHFIRNNLAYRVKEHAYAEFEWTVT